MTVKRASGTVRLARVSSGRRIAYCEYGDRSGFPVLFFHGLPGSRLLGALLDEPARRAAIRLVAPERPGYGRSDPVPRRTLVEWADDMRVLASLLQLPRLGVLGVSGGGPYALACAATCSDVAAAAVVSGYGPIASETQRSLSNTFTRFGARSAVRAGFMVQAARVRRGGINAAMRMTRRFPAVDQAALQKPGVLDVVLADYIEAFAQGTAAAAQDLCLLDRHWSFDLDAIQVPVTFWHGGQDLSVSVAAARAQAASVPSSSLRILFREGHVSLLVNHGFFILQALSASAAEPDASVRGSHA